MHSTKRLIGYVNWFVEILFLYIPFIFQEQKSSRPNERNWDKTRFFRIIWNMDTDYICLQRLKPVRKVVIMHCGRLSPVPNNTSSVLMTFLCLTLNTSTKHLGYWCLVLFGHVDKYPDPVLYHIIFITSNHVTSQHVTSHRHINILHHIVYLRFDGYSSWIILQWYGMRYLVSCQLAVDGPSSHILKLGI